MRNVKPGAIYADFNADRFPVAFYRGGRNPDAQIPGDALEISREDWHEYRDNPGERKLDATSLRPVPYAPPPPPVIDPGDAAEARFARGDLALLLDALADVLPLERDELVQAIRRATTARAS